MTVTYTTELSQREQEVLRLMSDGCTNAQIGRRLYIAENTVKSHVRRILRKTGASERTNAVAIAYESGLIGTFDTSAWKQLVALRAAIDDTLNSIVVPNGHCSVDYQKGFRACGEQVRALLGRTGVVR